jgi:hypothetical protein
MTSRLRGPVPAATLAERVFTESAPLVRRQAIKEM